MEQKRSLETLDEFISAAEAVELPPPDDLSDREKATFYMLGRMYPRDEVFRTLVNLFMGIFAYAASQDKPLMGRLAGGLVALHREVEEGRQENVSDN